MTREEIDELDIIIRDLRLAMDIRDQIEAGEERGLIDFADGESIKVPIPQEVKAKISSKIVGLEKLLKQRITAIKEVTK